MADTDPTRHDDVDRVHNVVHRVKGFALLAGSIDGDVNLHVPRHWYRDPAVIVLTVVTLLAATTALVLYLRSAGDKYAVYVDAEECKSLTWPGPATAGTPQQIQAKDGMAGYAVIRQTPCWRAETPELSAPFTPESGITVLCSVNADYVFDSASIPRYDWYLVADPTRPGRTLGWTNAWPYTAPSQPVPPCGSPSRPGPPVTTILAAVLALLAMAFLAMAIWRRRLVKAVTKTTQPAPPPPR